MEHNQNDPTISLEEHIHRGLRCYPTLMAGVTIADGGGPWVETAVPAQVIPPVTITDPFCIVEINVEDYIIAPDLFEMEFYYGPAGGEALIGRRRFTLMDPVGPPIASHIPPFPFRSPVQMAGERISARLASLTGGNSLTFSLGYIVHV